jgi:hypothetical protein
MKTKTLFATFIAMMAILATAYSASATLSDGLVAYWNFDESSGTLVGDILGMNDGTATASVGSPPAIITGKFGNARSFQKSEQQYISFLEDQNFNLGTSPFSVSFWYRNNSAFVNSGDQNYIISKQDLNAPYSSWAITIPEQSNEGQLVEFNNVQDSNYMWFDRTTPFVNTGDWVHLTLIYTGTNVLRYTNGVLTSNHAVDVPYSSLNSIAEFTIGGRDDITAFLQGDLDEVGIWNRELTQAEITSLSTAPLTLETPKPSFYVKDLEVKSTGFAFETQSLSCQYKIKNNQTTNIQITWEMKDQNNAITPIHTYDYTYNNVPLNKKILTTTGTGTIPKNTILIDKNSYRCVIQTATGTTIKASAWKKVDFKENKALAYAICKSTDNTGICRPDAPYIKYPIADGGAGSSLKSGLMGYWGFDETNGDEVTDLIGQNNGLAHNSPTIIDGKIGKAKSFNKTQSQYISFLDDQYFNMGNGQLSVSFWYRNNSASVNSGDQNYIISKQDLNEPYNSWFVSVPEQSDLGQYLEFGNVQDSTYMWDERTTPLLNTGNWIHIVLTYNGTNTLRYTNGVLTSNNPVDTAFSSLDSDGQFTIGARDELIGFLQADLDEVGLWSKTLTQNEVNLLYNSGNGQKPSNTTTTNNATICEGNAQTQFMTDIQNGLFCQPKEKVQIAIQNMTTNKNCLETFKTLFKNADCKLEGAIKVSTNNVTTMKVTSITGGENADHSIVYTNPEQPINYAELGFEKDDSGKVAMNTFFTIEANEIAIDSANAPSANAPATLVWEGITTKPGAILKDGSVCSADECTARTYNAETDTYTFDTQGFSEFSLYFPNGDETSLKNSVIDTIVKTIAGFGAFAMVLGIFIGGALMVYSFNYVRKK